MQFLSILAFSCLFTIKFCQDNSGKLNFSAAFDFKVMIVGFV